MESTEQMVARVVNSVRVGRYAFEIEYEKGCHAREIIRDVAAKFVDEFFPDDRSEFDDVGYQRRRENKRKEFMVACGFDTP